MNISKTDLLLLNKIKFGAKETEEPTEAPVPEETKASADKGMNALMFQGMNNLMSNPNLAQKVGANNVAFQGKLLNAKTMGMSAAAILGALALASCNPDPDEITQTTNVNVQVDQEMASMMQQMLAELQALRQDYNNGNKEMLARIDALTSILNSMLSTLNTLADNDNVTRQQIQTLIGLVQNLVKAVETNNLSDEEFKAQILANQQAIIALLKAQGADSSKALALLQEILNSNASLGEKLEKISALLGDIKSMFAVALNYLEKADKDRNILIDYAKQTAINTSSLVNYAKLAYESDSIQILNQEKLLAKLDIINIDMNAGISNLAKQLGISQNEIITMLQKMGYTLEQINNMTAGEIVNAIKENTAAVKNVNTQLAAIIAQLQAGQISAEEAAAKIIEIMNSINDKLGAILFQLTDLNSKFTQYAQDSKDYLNTIIKNQKLNTEAIKNGFEAEAARQDMMIQQNNEIKEAILSLKQSLESGNDDVIKAIKENSELIKLLGLDVNANASEIKAAMENWLSKIYSSNVEQADGIKTIITMLGKYLPFLEKQGNIAPLLQDLINVINQNGDKVVNAMDENSADIQAKIDALKPILEQISNQINKILDKMDAQVAVMTQYGDKILEALKENQASIDALQFETPDLSVIVNYLKELTKNSQDANNYLDIISKKQAIISQQIAELEAKAGRGLTAEELEALWLQHDADNYNKYTAFLNSIHAESMDKADEIIGYMKQGNQICLDIYNKIDAWKASVDMTLAQNLEILNKIYEYLPKLICNCQCGGDVNNDEGIRDAIDQLIQ